MAASNFGIERNTCGHGKPLARQPARDRSKVGEPGRFVRRREHDQAEAGRLVG